MEEYITCSRIRRLNIAKMPIPCNLIYKLNRIPFKIQGGFFVATEKSDYKHTWKNKGARTDKSNFGKE
jgi:hypothetical protein